MINKYSLNDRVSTIDNYLGTIRYIGNLPVWGTNTVALELNGMILAEAKIMVI